MHTVQICHFECEKRWPPETNCKRNSKEISMRISQEIVRNSSMFEDVGGFLKNFNIFEGNFNLRLRNFQPSLRISKETLTISQETLTFLRKR